MTNWDRIKLMNVEEAARELSSGCPLDVDFINAKCSSAISCAECWERWLNTDITLKPCPFCGKRVAEVKTIQEICLLETDLVNPNYYSIRCNYHKGGCGTTLGGEYETEEEAIEKWNTRYKEK